MSMGSNPVFPIININYNLSFISNLITINRLRKILSFKIIFSKQNLNIIKFFKKINLIYKYTIIKNKNKNYIRINLYFFKNNKIAPAFKIISKPSKKFFISLNSLRLLDKKTGRSLFLISSSKGLLTQKTALKYKTSGYIVGFLTI